jgi:hypothetical protein
MKSSAKIVAQLALALSLIGPALAQEAKQVALPDKTNLAAPQAPTERLSDWEWYQDVQLPAWKAAPRWVDLVVPPGVFDKARRDLGDLRLYDSKNREVPYALRIRVPRDEQEPLVANEFNRARAADRTAELSVDLNEAPREHSEITLKVNGNNYRRKVLLDGSNDGATWNNMKLDREYVVHFEVDAQVVDVSRFRYTPSRYRYLRVRVSPDPGLDKDEPEIASMSVLRTLRVPGEDVTLPATLGERQPERGDGGPGSTWMIELGDAAPCQRLNFDIADTEFSRNWRLELPGSEDEEAIIRHNQHLGTGHWERRAGDKIKPMEIELQPEQTVRRLRLVVTDYSNAPLNITTVRSTAPVRQMIIAPTPELMPPLRLYFGEPRAARPQYDFEALLPANLEPAPLRATLDPIQKNPTYVPPPKPFTERWPWLVYLVLGAASLILLAILAALGREAIGRYDKSPSADQVLTGA